MLCKHVLHLTALYGFPLSLSLFQPSSLLERATPGWAQGILSAHNVAQSSLSRSQVHDNLTALPTMSVDHERVIRGAQRSKTHEMEQGGPQFERCCMALLSFSVFCHSLLSNI